MLPTMMEVVCRTSNRLFVGLPLCESRDCACCSRRTEFAISSPSTGRNRDYVELNKRFTFDIFVGGQIIRLFPDILKPYVDPTDHPLTIDRR